ncbi:MAG: DUF58 domain-containing protein [Mariniblastus sp.]
MLTIRSSAILALSVWALALSLFERQEAVSMIALAFLFWVFLEWIFFQRIVLSTNGVLRNCRRVIGDQSSDQSESVTLVADREFPVQLTGEFSGGTAGYRLLIRDVVPETFELPNGQTHLIVDSRGSKRFTCNYTIKTPMCGKMDFAGIQVEISDYWGFFRCEQFIPVAQMATVLPFLIRAQTTVSVLKHNNLQRHIGNHRHKSSGVSSELLGIRDYRTGDPPRTIAWKPTARLGKLMTCEFENEVPIRATMIVDLATYQFEGRPAASPADRAITATASLAKLLLADRDPVAAVLMKRDSAQRIDHGSGERQLTRLLQHLLIASNPNPPLRNLEIEDLVQAIFDNCSRRFPELFDQKYNEIRTRRTRSNLFANKQQKIRSALCIVLEHLLNLQPGMANRMHFDNGEMQKACLQYVDKFSVVSHATTVQIEQPWADASRWRRESEAMSEALCKHLTDARSRAKDNELFVLIAPEPISAACVEKVVSAVKMAIAARHRVIYVAPIVTNVGRAVSDSVAQRILAEAGVVDTRNAESDLRLSLTSLGTAFARLDDPALMQIVANEVGVLQSGKSRGKVLRGGRV